MYTTIYIYRYGKTDLHRNEIFKTEEEEDDEEEEEEEGKQ